MNIFSFFGKNTFSHGIHPCGHKDKTEDKEIRRMPFPAVVTLPLQMNIGKPAVAIVKKGDAVQRGQMIAKPDGFMSVPLHSSVTGIVQAVKGVHNAQGVMSTAIIIETSQTSRQDIVKNTIDILQLNDDSIINAVQSTGIVGLGGACFPTHVKLSPPKEHNVHTVLINGCECEPFLTTDHRVMLERIDYLLLGIKLVMKGLKAEKAIIGIEDNKSDAYKAILKQCPSDGSITIEQVSTKYPQGAEKMLTTALLDIEIPTASIPSSVGIAIFNVATLSQMAYLMSVGSGLVERVVTITGPGVKHPGNYIIPFGTSLRYALQHAGYEGEAEQIILGGPMMGNTVSSIDVPVVKGTSAILVLDVSVEDFRKDEMVYDCIHCGKCLEACPLHLNPCEMGLLAEKQQYEKMQNQFNLNDCFECGSCSFVCPSSRPLVEYFRIAKAVNRKNS